MRHPTGRMERKISEDKATCSGTEESMGRTIGVATPELGTVHFPVDAKAVANGVDRSCQATRTLSKAQGKDMAPFLLGPNIPPATRGPARPGNARWL